MLVYLIIFMFFSSITKIKGLKLRMVNKVSDRYMSNHRFWTEIVPLSNPKKNDVDSTVDSLSKVLDHCNNVGRRLDVGIVFAPKSNTTTALLADPAVVEEL